MFKPYKDILSYPGAAQFSAAGLIARFPMSMQSLSVLLMISALYSQYSIAGKVNAALTIAFACGNPFLARWADRFGQSKVLFPALSCSATGLILLIVAILTKQSAWVLYTLAIITGLSTGSFGAYTRTRWSNVLRDQPRKNNTAFALEAALDEVVFVIGPILATILVTSVHPAAGLVACLLTNVSGGFWFLSQKRTEPRPQPRVKTPAAHRERTSLVSGAMVILCLVYLLCGVEFGVLDLSVVAFCREAAMASLSGALLAIVGAGSLTSALVYGSREWRFSALRLFAGGIVLMALAFSTFVFTTSLGWLVLSLVLVGLTYAPTMTNSVNLLQIVVPAGRFTEGMAWFNTAYTVGISLGSWMAGQVLDSKSARGGLILVAICSWVMLLIVICSLKLLRDSLRRARMRAQAKVKYHLEQDQSVVTKQPTDAPDLASGLPGADRVPGTANDAGWEPNAVLDQDPNPGREKETGSGTA